MEGWIKIHRKILDNPIVCKDSDYFMVWMYLLLNASHKDYSALFRGKRITLHAGQLITGRLAISKATGVESHKVYRILEALKTEQQIEQQASSKNSLITILNWEIYQSGEQQNEQRVSNKRATREHKQEYKNIKNIRNNYISLVDSYDFESLERELCK